MVLPPHYTAHQMAAYDASAEICADSPEITEKEIISGKRRRTEYGEKEICGIWYAFCRNGTASCRCSEFSGAYGIGGRGDFRSGDDSG